MISYSDMVSEFLNSSIEIKHINYKSQDPQNKILTLKSDIEDVIANTSDKEEILSYLPETYELYNDLILLPHNALKKENEYYELILETICRVFRKRIFSLFIYFISFPCRIYYCYYCFL